MMYRWRKGIVTVLFVGALLTLGVLSMRYRSGEDSGGRSGTPSTESERPAASRPPEAATASPVPEMLIANVHPFREATVSAPVSGTIQARDVRAGQRIPSDQVPAGDGTEALDGRLADPEESNLGDGAEMTPYPSEQVLVRLDTREVRLRLKALKTDLEKARIRYRQARRDARRIRDAYEQSGEGKVFSKSDLEEAEQRRKVRKREHKSLLTEWKKAVERARDHFITAPFSGTIGNVSVERGEWVSPGQPLFTVMDLSRVKVAFYVTERLLPAVRERERLSFRADAYPDREKPFSGRVYSISPATDPDRHRFRVVLALPNPDRTPLQPGMICRVHTAPLRSD